MKQIQITRDRDSFKWRENHLFGWSHFTDNVKDVEAMKNYLTQGGRLNDVSLSFVTADNKEANIFEILQTKSGNFDAVLNGGQRRFPLHPSDFVPVEEAINFFSDKATPEVNEAASNLKGLFAVEYYLKNADDNTKSEYSKLVTERMSETGIKDFLKNYEPGRISEVYFLNESE